MEKISVSIIMGSQLDWLIMHLSTLLLTELGIGFESKVVSAHRTPDRLWQFASQAAMRGIDVIGAS